MQSKQENNYNAKFAASRSFFSNNNDEAILCYCFGVNSLEKMKTISEFFLGMRQCSADPQCSATLPEGKDFHAVKYLNIQWVSISKKSVEIT